MGGAAVEAIWDRCGQGCSSARVEPAGDAVFDHPVSATNAEDNRCDDAPDTSYHIDTPLSTAMENSRYGRNHLIRVDVPPR